MEKISVIVPVYNIESYLGRCLNSILNQTYKNIQIIIVDDGSTDGSSLICDQFEAEFRERIKVFHTDNHGVSKARILGIQAADSEWIGFVDGDDVIEPEMYQKLIQNAIDNQAEISHCGQKMVFPDGRIKYYYNSGKKYVHNTKEGIHNLLSGEFVEPGLCNKIYRRELFQAVLREKTFDTTIRINEDLLLNYYLFSATKKSVYEDFCPYAYMVRYSSATRDSMNSYRIYDPIKVKSIILDDAEEDWKIDAQIAYLSSCINTYNILTCENKRFIEDKRNIRKLILESVDAYNLLPNKTRLLAYLIKDIPLIYPIVYRVYVKFFQKRKYE